MARDQADLAGLAGDHRIHQLNAYALQDLCASVNRSMSRLEDEIWGIIHDLHELKYVRWSESLYHFIITD